MERQDRNFFGALLAVVVVFLWLLPAGSSFWRDETGTLWDIRNVISGSLSSAWIGQSPVYYWIAGAASRLGGPMEFVLRIPSMLAMAGAVYLLYLVALRLFDRGTALLAALIFVCLQHVAFAANDARPYALALFAVNLSTLLILRWLDRGGWFAGLAFAASAAFVVYCHYFFAPVLVVHGLYALYRIWKGCAVRFPAFAAAVVGACIFVVPLASHVATLYHDRQEWSLNQGASLFDLFGALTPATLVGPILIGFALAFAFGFTKGEGTLSRINLLWLCAWSLFVPVLYFLLTNFVGLSIFIPRYLLSAAPGLALLTAGIVSSLASGRSRRIIGAALAAGAILSFGLWRLHGNEDWRGAMAAVRTATAGTNTPVLFASPFEEGANVDKVRDPSLKVMFTPVEIYPIGQNFIRLPMATSALQSGYLEEVAAGELKQANSFVLVTASESLIYQAWYIGRFADRLVSIQDLGDFGSVYVLAFTLRPDQGQP